MVTFLKVVAVSGVEVSVSIASLGKNHHICQLTISEIESIRPVLLRLRHGGRAPLVKETSGIPAR
jgi:hypothetical protein